MQDLRFTSQTAGQRERTVQFDLSRLLGTGGSGSASDRFIRGTGLAEDGGPCRLDAHHRPRHTTAFGDTAAGAHEVLRLSPPVDGDHHMALNGKVAQPARHARLAQIHVDVLRDRLHREFAERRQVGRREKRLQRLGRLFGKIDLALIEPFDQFARRQVHQPDVAQPDKHRVRHGLADPYAGYLVDHIVQAFQVLDIDGGVDVDAGVEQLIDVLPATFMATARRIAVSQFVHESHRRPASQQGVEIHLLEQASLVFDPPSRDQGQAVNQRLRFASSMRLDDTNDDIRALTMQLACSGQHGVGLADSRRRTEKHREPARRLTAQFLDQGVRLLCALRSHRHLDCHTACRNDACAGK